MDFYQLDDPCSTFSNEVRIARINLEMLYSSVQDIAAIMQAGRHTEKDADAIKRHKDTINRILDYLIGLADGSIHAVIDGLLHECFSEEAGYGPRRSQASETESQPETAEPEKH